MHYQRRGRQNLDTGDCADDMQREVRVGSDNRGIIVLLNLGGAAGMRVRHIHRPALISHLLAAFLLRGR